MYALHPVSRFALVLCSLVLSGLGSAGCKPSKASDAAAPAGPPAALAAAAWIDQDGRARAFADFAGKTVVFSLFFTSCPSVCPRETKALAEAQRRLSPELRGRVRFVSMSVDPETDSPDALRRFALAQGADLSSWSFVRASVPATRALTRELAVFPPSSSAESPPSGHTTTVYVFDGRGRLMQRYAGSPLDVPRLAREIERLDAWSRKKET